MNSKELEVIEAAIGLVGRKCGSKGRPKKLFGNETGYLGGLTVGQYLFRRSWTQKEAELFVAVQKLEEQ